VTTVAANKTSMACDLQFTKGNVKLRGSTKILELDTEVCKEMFGCKKALLGFSGNADTWSEVVNWFYDMSEKPPRCKGIEFLLLNDKKQLYHGYNLRNWMLLPDKHFAIGSGEAFAIGAMTAGKSPLEAVKVAGQHDVNTGMGYREYSI